jgi:hypothetical protein
MVFHEIGRSPRGQRAPRRILMSQRVIVGPPVSMHAWITVADWSCAAMLAVVAVTRKTAVPAAASKRTIVVPPFKRSLPDFSRLIASTLSRAGADLNPGSWPNPDHCVSWPLTPQVSDSR